MVSTIGLKFATDHHLSERITASILGDFIKVSGVGGTVGIEGYMKARLEVLDSEVKWEFLVLENVQIQDSLFSPTMILGVEPRHSVIIRTEKQRNTCTLRYCLRRITDDNMQGWIFLLNTTAA